jgi:hypothetical protein
MDVELRMVFSQQTEWPFDPMDTKLIAHFYPDPIS